MDLFCNPFQSRMLIPVLAYSIPYMLLATTSKVRIAEGFFEKFWIASLLLCLPSRDDRWVALNLFNSGGWRRWCSLRIS